MNYNDKYLSFVIKSIFQRPEEDKIELAEASTKQTYVGYARVTPVSPPRHFFDLLIDEEFNFRLPPRLVEEWWSGLWS